MPTQQRQMTLAVDFDVAGYTGASDVADGRQPIDAAGHGVDLQAGLDSGRPASDAGDMDGAIPQTVFVSVHLILSS